MPEPFNLNGKRVWVAGHRGMAGSAIVRRLAGEHCDIIVADRDEVDLRRQADVETWIERARPDASLRCGDEPAWRAAHPSHRARTRHVCVG